MNNCNKYIATETVWPSHKDSDGISPDYFSKGYQKKALLQFCVMHGIGSLMYFVFDTNHSRVMAIVIWGLACVILISGLFIPSVFRKIEAFGNRFAEIVSVALTWGLLVPFFFLFFVPGRFFLFIRGKDPLQRAYLPKDESYWVSHKPINSLSQYRKQH